jgi:hypothetical protein
MSLITLTGIFVVLLVADYELLLFNSKKKQKDHVYLSAGMIDKLFNKESQEKYSNIVTGNIFNLETKTEKIKPSEMPVVNTEFILEIRGLTITPQERYALLWDKQEQKSIVAKEGEEIKKWQVLSIYNDRIVLGSADIKREILLNPTDEKLNNNEK